jgi:hypothetical protein
MYRHSGRVWCARSILGPDVRPSWRERKRRWRVRYIVNASLLGDPRRGRKNYRASASIILRATSDTDMLPRLPRMTMPSFRSVIIPI